MKKYILGETLLPRNAQHPIQKPADHFGFDLEVFLEYRADSHISTPAFFVAVL